MNRSVRSIRAGFLRIFRGAYRCLRRDRSSQDSIQYPCIDKSFQYVVFCPRLNALGSNLLIGRFRPNDERDLGSTLVQVTHCGGWVRLEHQHLEECYIGAVFLKRFQ
ncbi:MAG: hypothetical protein ABSG77_07010 [Candidatus Acidiferrum sp.]